MDKCREAFEQYIRDQSGFAADFQVGPNGQYRSDLMHFMFVTWRHQQAKLEELQKKNAWLDDVAERENKRANKLQEENVFTTVLLGKVEQQKAELQKRVEWLEGRLKATDTLSKMRAGVIGSFKTQEFNARTRRKMMILKQAEQALKGEE